MPIIKIDRVLIRLIGTSSEKARSMADGLGESILRQLAGISDVGGHQNQAQFRHIDAGTIQTPADVSNAAMRRHIAAQIGEAVQRTLGNTGGKRETR
jgi:phenylpyruvate tautomerase PptA (4-oxalocrotonate tautomerase family)